VFLIPTYVRRSPIHGLGVFTSIFIPSGQLIWKFEPEVDWTLTEEDIDRFPEAYRDKLRSYCYLDESGLYVLCGDAARFMNHSDTPNCDDWSGMVTTANQDIQPDEELTCDYRAFDVASRDERAEPYITGK
jgi:SET domain-containing protein